jgi:hypothetical protein
MPSEGIFSEKTLKKLIRILYDEDSMEAVYPSVAMLAV